MSEGAKVRSGDRAGREFWNATWADQKLPAPIAGGIAHYPHRRIERALARALAGRETRGKTMLEIGCAQSVWLPHMARRHGFVVSGLAYSERGCALARAVLAREGVPGEIVLADFRDPPARLLGSFDVVSWFGVLEHFDDTRGAIEAASRFLKPGGLLISEIPNLMGAVGWLQRALHRAVFDVHVPLGAEALEQEHRAAGLEVVACEYVAKAGIHTLNLAGVEGRRGSVLRALHLGVVLAARAVWAADERFGLAPPGRFSAGYVVCTAEKPVS